MGYGEAKHSLHVDLSSPMRAVSPLPLLSPQSEDMTYGIKVFLPTAETLTLKVNVAQSMLDIKEMIWKKKGMRQKPEDFVMCLHSETCPFNDASLFRQAIRMQALLKDDRDKKTSLFLMDLIPAKELTSLTPDVASKQAVVHKLGHLKKLAHGSKSKWQDRFFVLRGYSLLYYTHELEYKANKNATPKESIPVGSVYTMLINSERHEKAGQKYTFSLRAEHVGKRNFVLCAPSAAERDDWMQHFERLFMKRLKTGLFKCCLDLRRRGLGNPTVWDNEPFSREYLEQIQFSIDHGWFPNLTLVSDGRVIVGLLFTFIASLRTPLIQMGLYQEFVALLSIGEERARLQSLKKLLQQVPNTNMRLVDFIVTFFRDVHSISPETQAKQAEIAKMISHMMLRAPNGVAPSDAPVRVTMLLLQHWGTLMPKADEPENISPSDIEHLRTFSGINPSTSGHACLVPACGSPGISNGYCNAHKMLYQRAAGPRSLDTRTPSGGLPSFQRSPSQRIQGNILFSAASPRASMRESGEVSPDLHAQCTAREVQLQARVDHLEEALKRSQEDAISLTKDNKRLRRQQQRGQNLSPLMSMPSSVRVLGRQSRMSLGDMWGGSNHRRKSFSTDSRRGSLWSMFDDVAERFDDNAPESVAAPEPPKLIPHEIECLSGLSEARAALVYQLIRSWILRFRFRRVVLQCRAQGIKKIKTRDRLVMELINTEQSYIEALKQALEGYQDPMETAGISKEDTSIIFSNLDDIYAIHRSFLRKLQVRTAANPYPMQVPIADIFMATCAQWKVYTNYVVHYVPAQATIIKLKASHATLLSDPHWDSALRGLLITPVQRIPRYVMLLKEIIANTSNEDEHELLNSAKIAVSSIADYVNEAQRTEENKQRISELETQIDGLELMPLLCSGWVSYRGKKKEFKRKYFRLFGHKLECFRTIDYPMHCDKEWDLKGCTTGHLEPVQKRKRNSTFRGKRVAKDQTNSQPLYAITVTLASGSSFALGFTSSEESTLWSEKLHSAMILRQKGVYDILAEPHRRLAHEGQMQVVLEGQPGDDSDRAFLFNDLLLVTATLPNGRMRQVDAIHLATIELASEPPISGEDTRPRIRLTTQHNQVYTCYSLGQDDNAKWIKAITKTISRFADLLRNTNPDEVDGSLAECDQKVFMKQQEQSFLQAKLRRLTTDSFRTEQEIIRLRRAIQTRKTMKTAVPQDLKAKMKRRQKALQMLGLEAGEIEEELKKEFDLDNPEQSESDHEGLDQESWEVKKVAELEATKQRLDDETDSVGAQLSHANELLAELVGYREDFALCMHGHFV